MVSPEMLRRYPCFMPIDEESLKQIAMISHERHVPAFTVLFRESEPADTLYLIIEGEVNIDYTIGSGERRTVDTLVPGDLLVWSALVAPHRTTAIGTTTKDTHLIAIEAEKLRELCERIPLLGYRLTIAVTTLLASRLDGTRVQLAVV